MRRWGLVCLAVLAAGLAVAALALAVTSLTATPTDLTFEQDVDAGATTSQPTVIKNTDMDPVTIETVSTDNAVFTVEFQPGDCAEGVTVLGENEECTVHVFFTPGTTGTETGTLTVASDGDDATVALTGEGTQTAASIDPPDINFQKQDINDEPVNEETATVTNDGTEPIDLTGIEITDLDAADFLRQTPTTGDCTDTETLDGGESCDIRIKFDPSTTGGKSATLTVHSNVDDLSVSLEGEGTQTSYTASPDPLDFDDQDIDDAAGQTLPVTVQNTGTEDVHLNAASITNDAGNDFTIETAQPGECDANTTLTDSGPSSSCIIRVTFDPSVKGAKTADLEIPSDELLLPETVSLTGTGIQTELTYTPDDTLSFTDQDIDDVPSGETLPVTVENTGSVTVDLNAASITGDPDGDFTLEPTTSGDCTGSTSLDEGESCVVRVTFDPDTTGDKDATLHIPSDQLGDKAIALEGTGIQTEITGTPDPLHFDDQDIDDIPSGQTLTVTVENTGTRPVDLNAVSITNDTEGNFQIEPAIGGDCTETTTLASHGDMCTVQITFDPGSVGDKTAQLEVPADQLASPETVELTGTGTQTSYSATPDPLQFADQDIDDVPSGDTLTVTVTNTGTQPIDLNDASITGDPDGDFTIESPTGGDCTDTTTLATTGAACTIDVTFDPGTIGDKIAQLEVPSDQFASPETVELKGTGTQTSYTATPDPLHFDDQDVDDPTGQTLSVTVENTGTEDINLDPTSITADADGDFTIESPTGADCTASTTLSTGGTCTVRITFNAALIGDKTATLHIPSTELGDKTVSLTGTATDFELTLTPTFLDFADQDFDDGPPETKTAVVESTGQSTIHLNALSIDGANPGDFDFATPSDPDDCDGNTVLDSGESCNVRITFDATAVHSRSATVQIPSDELPNETIDLTGEGIQTEITPDPSSIDFGSQDIKDGPTDPPAPVTIENTGTQRVDISTIVLGGDNPGQFKRLTGGGSDCVPGTTQLDAGETCEVRLVFDPSWRGAKAATLAVNSNADPISVLLSGTATQSVFPDSDAPLPDGFATDGTVNAVAFDSVGRTYIGGSFSTVGPTTGHGAQLNDSDGAVAPGFPDVDGPINDVESDGSGGWFIGGSFANVGGLPRASVAHIQSDGTVDPGWNPGTNGTVYALERSGTALYVGGDFTQAGGGPSSRLAKISTDTGTRDTGWTPNPNLDVRAIALGGTDVYIGGSFTLVQGNTHTRLAKVNADGDAESWAPDGPNGIVNALAVSGSDVYAGGAFTKVGTVTRNRIAKLDTSAGALDATWNPNANGDVLTLAATATDVYAGGAFTNIGTQPRNRIARLSATSTGAADGWNPNANAAVNALRLSGTDVYAAGAFTQIGGETRNRIARLSTSTGLADSWHPNANGTANALAVSGSNIYVGGAFTSVGGQVTRNRLARLLPDGTVDTDWDPNASGTVNALVVTGTDVYVGGAFTTINSAFRNRIAKLTTAAGAAVAPTWDANADNTVTSIAVAGPDVFVGGLFTHMGAGATARNRLVKVTAATGALDTTWNPLGASASSLSLVVSGSDLYAGGNFVTIGGQSRFFAAKLATGGAGAVDPNWKPNADAPVRALALAGSSVFAGGDFTSIGGQSRSRLAKLTTTDGTALMGWDANANGNVRALAVAGTNLYAGGDFSTVGSVSHNRVVRLPVDDGGAQDAGWNPIANGTVNALATAPRTLAAGGAFTTVGSQSRQGVALFDLPVLSSDPSSLQFGSQGVEDGPTTILETTVTNTGPDSVAFSSVTVQGPDASRFERFFDQGTDCTGSTTLAPGADCKVRVRFDPDSAGLKGAWVAIAGSNTPEATIGLSGRGTLTGLTPSVTDMPFGDWDVDDDASPPQTSVLTNSGSEPTTITGISIDGGAGAFVQPTVVGTDCFVTRVLNGGQSCNLRIQFDPTDTGPHTGTVTVTSDVAPDIGITLSGEGIQTRIEADTDPVAFGKQDVDDDEKGPITTVIENTGTEPVHLDAPAITAGSSDFAFPAAPGLDDCDASTTLLAGETCDVSVQFDPTTVGMKSGTLSIGSDELPDLTVALSGEGTQTRIEAAPTPLPFGDRDIDDPASAPMTSLITNTGTETVHFTSYSVVGGNGFALAIDDATPPDDCTSTIVLDAGESCAARVTFHPTTVGPKSANVVVGSTELPNFSIPLSGEGIQTSAEADPTSIDFLKQDIDDDEKGPETTVIRNTGTEDVHIDTVTLEGDADFDFATTGGTNDCTDDMTLAGGDTCDVRVTFDPATVGAKSGLVRVDTDVLPDITVDLDGEGTQTSITADPTSHDFGDQDLEAGPTDPPKTFTIENTGTEDVAIDGVSITGTNADQFDLPATAAMGDCTDTTVLEAGESCAVRVTFDPDSMGDKTAAATVDTDVLPDLNITLTGFGTQVELSQSPDTLAFGKHDIDAGAKGPETSTITNTGTETVTLTAVGISGTDAGDYHLPATPAVDDCVVGTELDATETCKVRVTFDPTVVGVKNNATATVTAGGVNVDVALTGEGTQTSLGASPDPVTFADQDIDGGTPETKTVTVQNTGTEPVDLNAASIANDADTDFSIVAPAGGDCTASSSLTAGQTCTIKVKFDPDTVGAKTADLVIPSDQLASVTVDLGGEGIQTSLGATPDPVAFADQDIDGGTPETKTVTVTNTGTEPVDLNAASITGDPDNDFAIVAPAGGDCTASSSLTAGQTCTIKVRFDPDTVGSKTADLVIPSDQLASVTVDLTGEGIQTSLGASPDPVAFADQDIDGGTPETKTVTVTNTGTEPVDLNGASIANDADTDFSIVAPAGGDCTASSSLTAGQTCTIKVRFDPDTVGSKTADLVIPSDQLASVTVDLTGEGIQTSIGATPDPVAFADQDIDGGTPETKTVTVTNTGTEPVDLNAASIANDADTDFSIVAPAGGDCTASSSLTAGQTCTIKVRFDPDAVGSKTADLVIPSDQLASVTVDLTGEGIQTSLGATPDPTGFADQDIDGGTPETKTVTVTNTGTEPVDLNAASIANDADTDFSIVAPAGGDCTASSSLTAGQTCTIKVRFDPDTVGSKTADLVIPSDQLASLTVDLTGEGIQTSLGATPDPVAFADQDIDGGTPETKTVTVTNTGTETVDLNAASIANDADTDFSVVAPAGGDCTASSSLTAGQTCTIKVTFDPDTVGSKTADLVIPSDQLANVTVDLTGEGTQTGLSPSLGSLSFGDKDIDDGATAAMTSVVTNSGTEDVTLVGVAVTGNFARATGDANDCLSGKTLLHAGDTCNLRVTFNPTATGHRTGSATVDSNAPDISVALDGDGTQTELSRSPASLAFGQKVVANGPTAAQTATITNTGTEDVTLTGVPVTGDFAQVTGNASDCLSGTALLHAGETCDLRVRFDPTVTGVRNGSATVQSNATSVSVSLSGEGVVSSLAAVPNSFAFGKKDIDDGASAVNESTITNNGIEAVTLSGVTLGGADAGDFNRLTGNGTDCGTGTVLAAGGTCKVRTSFDPAAVGAKTASVTVSAASVAPASVNLTGTGTQTTLGIAPGALDFGTQDVDAGPGAALESTITNTGTEQVTLTGVNLGGGPDFAQVTGDASDCANGTTLNPGEACKVRVRFDPDATGAKTGGVTVTSNAPDVGMTLAGAGIKTALSRDSDVLLFAPRNVAAGPSAPLTLTFKNTGTQPIALSGVSIGGANPTQFKHQSGQPTDCSASTTLAAGDECKARVRFDPSTAGPKAATVRLESSMGVDVITPLTGTGKPAPKLTVPNQRGSAARTSGRRLTVRIVPANGVIKGILVQVRSRGGKVLGSARVRSASRARGVVLRLKKPLAAGRYKLTARGRDAFGHTRRGRGKLTLTGASQRRTGGGGGGSNGGGGGGSG